MRRSAGPPGLVPAIVLLLLGGCETHARGQHFAEQIREAISKKGNDVQSVTCPDRIKIERRSTTFPCDIELSSGQRATLTVTINQEGDLSWTAE